MQSVGVQGTVRRVGADLLRPPVQRRCTGTRLNELKANFSSDLPACWNRSSPPPGRPSARPAPPSCAAAPGSAGLGHQRQGTLSITLVYSMQHVTDHARHVMAMSSGSKAHPAPRSIPPSCPPSARLEDVRGGGPHDGAHLAQRAGQGGCIRHSSMQTAPVTAALMHRLCALRAHHCKQHSTCKGRRPSARRRVQAGKRQTKRNSSCHYGAPLPPGSCPCP